MSEPDTFPASPAPTGPELRKASTLIGAGLAGGVSVERLAMKTNQHTPGPWKVAGVAWEVASGVWTRHIHTTEFVRGVVLGHQARGRTEAEVQANALLLAAAPDMLQMLRDIDAHFAAHFGEQAWATSEIGGMTRVTIAKAEGGGA